MAITGNDIAIIFGLNFKPIITTFVLINKVLKHVLLMKHLLQFHETL